MQRDNLAGIRLRAERCQAASAGATGWTPDPPLALAPSLSADPADRIIVALDGMAPEQALRFAARWRACAG